MGSPASRTSSSTTAAATPRISTTTSRSYPPARRSSAAPTCRARSSWPSTWTRRGSSCRGASWPARLQNLCQQAILCEPRSGDRASWPVFKSFLHAMQYSPRESLSVMVDPALHQGHVTVVGCLVIRMVSCKSSVRRGIRRHV